MIEAVLQNGFRAFDIGAVERSKHGHNPGQERKKEIKREKEKKVIEDDRDSELKKERKKERENTCKCEVNSAFSFIGIITTHIYLS